MYLERSLSNFSSRAAEGRKHEGWEQPTTHPGVEKDLGSPRPIQALFQGEPLVDSPDRPEWVYVFANATI